MISMMNEQLRRIVLSGNIGEDSAAAFLEQITALESLDISLPITVYVDTYGGSLAAASLIYDTIKTCACPVITVGIGKVMSAGVMILAAGDPGNRYITENTRVMIHEVSSGTHGSMSELDASVKETRYSQNTYVRLLADDTGNTKERILDDMAKGDFYMSAKESIKYGIADKIVPTRKKMLKKIATAVSKKEKAKAKKPSKKVAVKKKAKKTKTK